MNSEIFEIDRLLDLKHEIWWAEERDAQSHVPPNDMKRLVDSCVELDASGDLLLRVGALGGAPTARIREALEALNNASLVSFDQMLAARRPVQFAQDDMRIDDEIRHGHIHAAPAKKTQPAHDFSLSVETKTAADLTEKAVEPRPKTPVYISVINRLSSPSAEPDRKVAHALVDMYRDHQNKLTEGRAAQVAYAVARHDPSGRESYRMSQIEGAPAEAIKAALKLANASSPYLAAMEPSFDRAKSNHANAQAEKAGLLTRLGGWISERKERLSDSVTGLVNKVAAWTRDHANDTPAQATRVTIDSGDKLLIMDGQITASLRHGAPTLEDWAFKKACRDAIESTGMNLKSVLVAESDLLNAGWSINELVSPDKDHRPLPKPLTELIECRLTGDNHQWTPTAPSMA